MMQNSLESGLSAALLDRSRMLMSRRSVIGLPVSLAVVAWMRPAAAAPQVWQALLGGSSQISGRPIADCLALEQQVESLKQQLQQFNAAPEPAARQLRDSVLARRAELLGSIGNLQQAATAADRTKFLKGVAAATTFILTSALAFELSAGIVVGLAAVAVLAGPATLAVQVAIDPNTKASVLFGHIPDRTVGFAGLIAEAGGTIAGKIINGLTSGVSLALALAELEQSEWAASTAQARLQFAINELKTANGLFDQLGTDVANWGNSAAAS